MPDPDLHRLPVAGVEGAQGFKGNYTPPGGPQARVYSLLPDLLHGLGISEGNL
jgi:hypothetical protein